MHTSYGPLQPAERAYVNLTYNVRKMGLILRSVEWMPKMQISMARKFTLQPLRGYDVKPPKKKHTSVILSMTRYAQADTLPVTATVTLKYCSQL